MATRSSGKIIYLLVLLGLKSAFYASVAAATLEAEGNMLKLKEYSPFPLATDVDVELPLDVDEAVSGGSQQEELDAKQQLLPPWLQMPHNEPQQQQRISSGSAKAFIKMPPTQQHQHQHQQQQQQQQQPQHKHSHTSSSSSSSSSHGNNGVEQRCSIEISSKIPGVCQPMSHIGSACVSGEYMEVFNADCM